MYATQTKKRNTLISAAFLSPAMVLYLGFVIFAHAMSIYYSLTKWSGAGMPEFIGLRNFQRILKIKITGSALGILCNAFCFPWHCNCLWD